MQRVRSMNTLRLVSRTWHAGALSILYVSVCHQMANSEHMARLHDFSIGLTGKFIRKISVHGHIETEASDGRLYKAQREAATARDWEFDSASLSRLTELGSLHMRGLYGNGHGDGDVTDPACVARWLCLLFSQLIPKLRSLYLGGTQLTDGLEAMSTEDRPMLRANLTGLTSLSILYKNAFLDDDTPLRLWPGLSSTIQPGGNLRELTLD